ncbi:hypothetical protein BROUX41_001612 [Berkeleyomyces rouxiae]|uniref:uncharacterized protein n=1 Tax=Berkeleyomyces rouxiae TaxID=2035830 RepID=UPI003B79BA5B
MDSGDNNDKAVTRAWKVLRTVKEMVADRGFEMTEDEINMSLEDFRRDCTLPTGEVDRNRIGFSASPSESMIKKHTYTNAVGGSELSTDVGTVLVKFLGEESMGIQQIKNFIMTVVERHYKTAILITHTPLTSAARKNIAAAESYAHIEYFLEDDLIVNLTRHMLVPKHILLSREEKVALLKRYRLKDTQLPRILQKDPVAKYLGLKRGQVVKIIRNSETAGRYASYRLCV